MINDYYWFSMFFVLIMLPDAINSFLFSLQFFLGIDLVRNEPIWQFSRIKDSFAELLLL